MRPSLGAIFVLFCVMLSACAGSAARSTRLAGDEADRAGIGGLATVEIAKEVVLALPGPEELGDSLAATQLLTATYDEETYHMQMRLEWRPGSIALVGMNVFGTVMFTIEYDGRRVESRGSRMMTQRLLPEYVLADVLVTFWSIERLRSHLRGTGLELSEEEGRRVIARSGEPVIIVDYDSENAWEGPVRFDHVERDYVLDVVTVEFRPL